MIAALPVVAAEPLTDNDKAAMLLAAGQRAWQEKNYPFAVDRFREVSQSAWRASGCRPGALRTGSRAGRRRSKGLSGGDRRIAAAGGKTGFPRAGLCALLFGPGAPRTGTTGVGPGTHEASGSRTAAKQRRNRDLLQAEPQFAAAVTAFAAACRGARAVGSDERSGCRSGLDLRSRCSHAEMLLHLGKFADARKVRRAVARRSGPGQEPRSQAGNIPVRRTPASPSVNIRRQGRPWPHWPRLTTRSSASTPGTSWRRTHHVSEERPEALALYDAVLAGYEQQKKDAQTALQNPQLFKDNPDEKDPAGEPAEEPRARNSSRVPPFTAASCCTN